MTSYWEAGVPRILGIGPSERTVRVYRPGTEPELFNVCQERSGVGRTVANSSGGG
jgi:hypothetical protein